ncbi:class I SAM-dependent methyltransferase [Sulfurimonas sp.]
MSKNCPLCKTKSKLFYQDKQSYYKCENCYGIFVDETQLPDKRSEKARYELHSDDSADEGYRAFVAPITKNIEKEFQKSHKGLDFGAGTSQIITKVMLEKGYDMVSYDPFFHNYPKLLENRYDYIAACEVIEHFYNPYKEFKLLKHLLNKDARLYCMTDIYDESIDFAKWYYKNDLTHVFFYHKKTFEWIQEEFDFDFLKIDKRFILLK